MAYRVYILQSESTGQYYVGQANDIEDGLRRHNEGPTEANKGRCLWCLVRPEEFPMRQAAAGREQAIGAAEADYFAGSSNVRMLISRCPSASVTLPK